MTDHLLADAKVRSSYTASAGVEITRRSDGERTCVFALNHSDEKATVNVPQQGIDLITGTPVKSPLVLEPKGVAIIQLEGI